MTLPREGSCAVRAPSTFSVGIVGAGRVGAALGRALGVAGYRVDAASGRSPASLRRIAELLPGVPRLDRERVPLGADLVLLSVPDDALAGVAALLARSGGVRPGTLAVHTSGRYGTAVLSPLADAGALPVAMHPAMTFEGTAADVDRLRGAVFGVTCAESLVEQVHHLVRRLGGLPVQVGEQERALYHAGLAVGANQLVTVVSVARELLAAAGVADPAAALGPLLRAALDRSLRDGDAALTGPVVRGDAGTVRAHLGELARVSPQVVPSYVTLARLAADRALDDGRLAAADAAELLEVLGGATA